MVSDVLEAALKARNHALGPLHPSFGLVDIIRNGLRRILPVDAHKICSGRVHISLTRWRDGKNFLVNQFDTREELIQALVCSSFVPCYSGFVPPTFKGTFYWDGGLSNNNPILDENTILVTPFGGESDICPKGESAAFFCYDFKGTNLQYSYENMYRLSISLFPPDPHILKAICFRGYKDTIDFLKSRNLLECSCHRLTREKTSLSSVIGEDFHNYSLFEEKMEMESIVYDSEEDNLEQFAESNEPLNYNEMPTSVINVLDVACDENKGIINYVLDSQLSRALQIMFLPWTLPFEFSFSFTKRVLELLPKIKVSPNSTSILDTILIYLNFLIQKFTYDKYQYHARVTCNLCPRSRSNSQTKGAGIKFSVCYHNNGSSNKLTELIDRSPYEMQTKFSDTSSHTSRLSAPYYPKLCARHRVPSVCSSEATSHYREKRRSRRTTSNGSDMASSVDANEFKSKSSRYYPRKNSSSDVLKNGQESIGRNNSSSKQLRLSNKALSNGSSNYRRFLSVGDRPHQDDDRQKGKLFMVNEQNLCETDSLVPAVPVKSRSSKENSNRVHFHLNPNPTLKSTDEEDETDSISTKKDNPYQIVIPHVLSNENTNFPIKDLSNATNAVTEIPVLKEVEDLNSPKLNGSKKSSKSLNNSLKDKSGLEWDNDAYWDNLELNAFGQINP